MKRERKIEERDAPPVRLYFWGEKIAHFVKLFIMRTKF